MIEMSNSVDIADAIERWDELMDRCEAGDAFVITVNGQPKARLEPVAAIDRE